MLVEFVAIGGGALLTGGLLGLRSRSRRSAERARKKEAAQKQQRQKTEWTFMVPSNGLIVFTPILEAGRVYRVTCSGTYLFEILHTYSKDLHQADAAYFWDSSQAKWLPYQGLYIDGKSPKSLYGWEGGTELHEFTCFIDGEGKKAQMWVAVPNPSSFSCRPAQQQARLAVRLDVQPEGTLTIQAKKAQQHLAEEAPARAIAEAKAIQKRQQEEEKRRKGEEQQREQEAAAELKRQEVEAAEAARAAAATEAGERRREEATRAEAARAAAAEALKRQQVQRRVRDLSSFVHLHRNIFDDRYVWHYVTTNAEEILTSRDAWEREYTDLMGDADLIQLIRDQAPKIIEWYERRAELVLMAERLKVLPVGEESQPNVVLPLTARTIPQIAEAVEELFSLRAARDQARIVLVEQPGNSASRATVNRADRLTAFYLRDLRRFGIAAQTPEEAEDQFNELLPSRQPPLPVLTYYELLQAEVKEGSAPGADTLVERLEDLFREKVILAAKRRAAVRHGRDDIRDDIDVRLIEIRREATHLKSFLDGLGRPLQLDRRDAESREDSRSERFLSLLKEKQGILSLLTAEGDVETAEHVQALFAQEQSKLFGGTDATY